MAETKRMHFVPRTYLKHFAEDRDGEYFINALSKENTQQIREINIKNICVEKDIYTLPGETESERQFLENMYSTLYEKEYDTLYKILTDETKENVTPHERYSIISFVVSMLYRNNLWGRGFAHLMNESYEKAYHASLANGKQSFFFGEEEISIAGKTLEELQKENKKKDNPMIALTTAQHIFKLTRIRLMKDVVTVVKSTSDFEFITSDNPVTLRSDDINKRPIPIDPTNTLVLPIDKNHLLQLSPWASELDVSVIGRITEHSLIAGIQVAINNQYQLAQSSQFVLGTKAGIKKFQEKPGGILHPSHNL